jgi:hypothetical protein
MDNSIIIGVCFTLSLAFFTGLAVALKSILLPHRYEDVDFKSDLRMSSCLNLNQAKTSTVNLPLITRFSTKAFAKSALQFTKIALSFNYINCIKFFVAKTVLVVAYKFNHIQKAVPALA